MPDPANRGNRLYKNLEYRFNRNTTENGVDKGRALGAIRAGTANVAGVQNPCGIGDGVGHSMIYVGSTGRGTDANASGGCNAPDGYNVVGFGDLPRTATAQHCGATDLRAFLIADDGRRGSRSDGTTPQRPAR